MLADCPQVPVWVVGVEECLVDLLGLVDSVHGVSVLLEVLVVVNEELPLLEVLGLGGIDAIFSVVELNETAITIADSEVVLDGESFKVLDETPLQVATPARLDSSVNQSFSSGHAVEEELLRSESTEEAIGDVASCPWVGVVALERRECSSGGHYGHSPPFEFLLA